MDLSIFATPEAWISLVTLMFLEIVLGVDNLVFIVLTSDRLPPEKQHIGRKLGLLGALVSRVVFLCFASFLVHMTDKLFTIPGLYINGAEFGLSVRDLVLFLGGLYLIYKGIVELRDVLKLSEEKESQGDADKPRKTIGLAGAVATIMVMDIVLDMHAEKLMVYFAMVFAIVLEVIQMRYNKNYQEWTMRKNLEIMRARGYDPQNTDTIQLANALIEAENLKKDPNNKEAI